MENTFNQSFSILFWLNKNRPNASGEFPIYMRVTVAGKRVEISLQRFINAINWDQAGQRVRNKAEGSAVINSFLDLSKGKIQSIYNQLLSQNMPITATVIKQRYAGKQDKPTYKTLCAAFDYHNLKMAETVKIGKISPKTLLKYQITKGKVIAFMQDSYGVSDKPLPDLRLSFITEFEHYLITKGALQTNTAHKYIKNVKKVMNMAVGLDWIPSNRFSQFKCSCVSPDRQVLTQAELDQIMAKPISIPRIEQVRDVFIFCCYTGFAYADVYKFDFSSVTRGLDGELWLCTNRQKSGVRESVPLLQIPLQIIEKYRNNKYCVTHNKLLPVNSNQRYNSYLKELADICGIQKHLTTHIARHTFATTITLANGVPIESVSSMLGHRNIRTTQIYAKVVEKKVSDDMKALKEKLFRPSISEPKTA
jgi:site-specific recombinase XerD